MLKRTYYDSGELEKEYFEINGKKEGQYKLYRNNGELHICSNYIDGKLNGEYKLYTDNGNYKKFVIIIKDN